jgi:hypothetical protein
MIRLKPFLLLILTITIFNSCSHKSRQAITTPCTFDKDKLTIIGTDYFMYDSIDIKGQYPSRAILDLLGYNFEDGYRLSLNDANVNHIFNYKIVHCKDMEWAKKQILNEITQRYPYRIVDSTETHRTYDYTFLDTSYFIPTVFTNPDDVFFGNDGNVEFMFNSPYPGVLAIPINSAEENKDKRVHIGKVEPPHLRSKLYDITLPHKFIASPVELDEYFTYLKDSMSVIVELAEEKVIPVKYIRLINNSQEK